MSSLTKVMVESLREIADDLEKIEINEQNGCEGCAYITTQEWEMPCAKCKRNCKDYWRKGAENE